MQQVRKLRKERNLSMKEFGNLVGLAESTISLYENGKRQPDNEKLIQMADFFGVSVDYLLGRIEKETPPDMELSEGEKQLIALIKELTDEEAQELSNYVDFIISKRK